MTQPQDEARPQLVDVLRASRVLCEIDLRSCDATDTAVERRWIEGAAVLGALGIGGVVCRIDPREDSGWRLVRAASSAVPGLLFGVRWVRHAEELVAARGAGCAVAISPGLTFSLHEAAEEEDQRPDGVWLLPMVETLSEAFAAFEAEWSCVFAESTTLTERVLDALPELHCVARCPPSPPAVAEALDAGAVAVLVEVAVDSLLAGDVGELAGLAGSAQVD